MLAVIVTIYCFISLFRLCFATLSLDTHRELGERDSVKISVFDQKKILGRPEDWFLGCVLLPPVDIKRHLDVGRKPASHDHYENLDVEVQ